METGPFEQLKSRRDYRDNHDVRWWDLLARAKLPPFTHVKLMLFLQAKVMLSSAAKRPRHGKASPHGDGPRHLASTFA